MANEDQEKKSFVFLIVEILGFLLKGEVLKEWSVPLIGHDRIWSINVPNADMILQIIVIKLEKLAT